MAWFRRHLNWTIVLSSVVFRILGIILSAALASDPNATADVVMGMSGLYFIFTSATGLFICGWVLRQKARSLWWLFLFVVPLGWFVFLFLENQSTQQEPNPKISDRDVSEKARHDVMLNRIDKWWLAGRMSAAAFWWGLAGAGVGAIWGAAFSNIGGVVMWSGIGAAIFGGLIIGPMTYNRNAPFGAGLFLGQTVMVTATIGGIVWLVRSIAF